jgi:DNA-binding response OmpR family regulator
MAKILIADDERRLLELLERVLDKRGHEVETFGDGASAIEAIEGGGEYDLVLSDIRMPAKGGLEVLEASKRRRPRTPVILISGATEPEDRARAEAAGVYMLLHKPVDLAYLMTIIDSALDHDVAGRRPPAQKSAEAAARAPAPRAAEAAAGAARGGGAASAGRPEDRSDGQGPLGVRVIDREACLENMVGYCLKRQGYRVVGGAGMRAPAIAVVGLLGAIEAVRRDAPEATVIALYAQESPEDAVRALDAGADVAIARPFDPEVLFAHVRAAARRRGAPAGMGAVASGAGGGAGEAVSGAAAVGTSAGRPSEAERPPTRNRIAAARN